MRGSYRPSGQLILSQFVLWSLATCAAAVLLGLIAFGLFLAGFYLVFIVPCVAAAGIGAANHLAVIKSHCRNYWAPTFAGLIAAVLFFVAYFQAGIVYELGVEGAVRIDLLPAYVQARMESDVIGDVAQHADGKQPVAWENWGLCALEMLFVSAISIIVGRKAVGNPYCEAQDEWMSVATVICKGPTYVEFVNRLMEGPAVETFESLQPVIMTEPGALYLRVFYCERRKYPNRPTQMFLTIGGLIEKKESTPVVGPAAKGGALELFPEEFPVVGRLGNLALRADGTASAAPAVINNVPFVEALSFAYPAMTLGADQRWQITLKSLQYLWIVLMAILVSLAFFLASTGVIRIMESTFIPFAIALTLFFTATFGALIYESCCRMPLKNRLLREALLEAIARRTDRPFDPSREEVFFVERQPIPALIQLVPPHKIGFLRIDAASGLVRWEGEEQRWNVPLMSMKPSIVSSFNDGHSGDKPTALLRAVDEEGNELIAALQVLPLTGLEQRHGRQKQNAQRLCDALNEAAEASQKSQEIVAGDR